MQEKNLKITSARKELLEVLNSLKRPVSFEDIKHKITMDKATFYRNISKFESESLVNSFESNGKKRYYEIRQFPHAHFVCNVCNTIECLGEIPPPTLVGYTILDALYKGICRNCTQGVCIKDLQGEIMYNSP